MITDLQRQVRTLVARLPQRLEIALAGGAALIVSGIVNRVTEDLDFFLPHPRPVGGALGGLEEEMAAAGLQVDRLRGTETFARLRVESDADITYVDLATDARLMPAVHTPDGPVLAESDLAADKTLVLTGRAETRDYVDFHALAHRFDLDELCTLAEAKDGGFRAAQLGAALSFIVERHRDGFDLDDAAYRELRSFALSTARTLQLCDQRDPYGL